MEAQHESQRESEQTHSGLLTCADALDEAYDLAMLDLDGVVYVGGDAVPGAPDHIAAARAAGMRIAFITNNAARPPGTVAEHLRELGVEATDDDVVTSAQAAARVLVERLGEGARVAVLGADGLLEAVPGGGPRAGGRRGRGRGGAGDRVRAPGAVAPDHARRGAGARRAVVGGQQHRHVDPDAVRHRSGARGARGHGAAVQRRRAGGGRQARPAAAGRDGAPGAAGSGR